MATYIELREIIQSPDGNVLRKRVEVATILAARNYLAGSPTANQRVWSVAALDAPESAAQPVLRYIIAANNAATVAQITGVTDANLQTAVNLAATALAG